MLAVLVIAARVLSTREFAALGVSLAVATVLTCLLDAGSSVALVRDAEGSRERALASLRASARGRMPLALVVWGAGVLVGAQLDRPVESVLVLVLATLGAAALSLLAVFRVAETFSVEVLQKLTAATLGLAATVVFVVVSPTSAAVLAGLALGAAVTLPAVGARLRDVRSSGTTVSPVGQLLAAAPFGVIALSTIFYYRAPTIVLGVQGTAEETASFALASTLAFGLLAVPNAITSGLLPRLSGLGETGDQVAVARRALVWSLQLWALLAITVGTLAGPLLSAAFGQRYATAAGPLVILLAGGLLIAASGVLGTVLVARRHTGAVVVQVALSVAINLALAAALIPRWGAEGAAVVTLLTEAAALAVIAAAAWARIDDLLWRPSGRALGWAAAAAGLAGTALAVGGIAGVVAGAAAAICVVAAEPAIASHLGIDDRWWAWANGAALPSGVLAGVAGAVVLGGASAASGYAMRVISDTPTYLALIPRLADRPLDRGSPFLDMPTAGDSHASPYLQLLAFAWRWISAGSDTAGHVLVDPVALGRFLSLVGIAVTLVVLHAVFVFARREAGPKAAWVMLPTLLLLFGPAHVIWAGDLTFHGFLYAGYFPQTLAIAFLLATLLVTEFEPCWPRYLIGTACAAVTLLVHPFTGLVLAVLIAVQGSWLALRRDEAWRVGPVCLAAGFVVGLAWPAYSLAGALGEAGVAGPVLIAGCALVPAIVRVLPVDADSISSATWGLLERLDTDAARIRLAVGGAVLVGALAAWESWLFTQPNADPLITTNHLSLYWVEDRWRWPLMFGAGAVGLAGLARLALRGRPLPLCWFSGLFALGVAGALGAPLPIWWRFLLFCQIPLALGVAVVVAEADAGRLRRLVVATFAGVGIFKVATLLAVSPQITYFGTPVQPTYELARMIPQRPGLVAADPFLSYFIPGATGHRVLVVTKAHVNSRAELARSTDGYRLLHDFFMGDYWWYAAQNMYRQGVRYVLIDKQTSLRPATLSAFSTGPTPLVRTDVDRTLLGTYFYRNNRVGRLLVDSYPYVLYELDPGKLFG